MLLDDSHSRLLDDGDATERNESRPRKIAVTWERYSTPLLGVLGISMLMNIVFALQYHQLSSFAEFSGPSIYGYRFFLIHSRTFVLTMKQLGYNMTHRCHSNGKHRITGTMNPLRTSYGMN